MLCTAVMHCSRRLSYISHLLLIIVVETQWFTHTLLPNHLLTTYLIFVFTKVFVFCFFECSIYQETTCRRHRTGFSAKSMSNPNVDLCSFRGRVFPNCLSVLCGKINMLLSIVSLSDIYSLIASYLMFLYLMHVLFFLSFLVADDGVQCFCS